MKRYRIKFSSGIKITLAFQLICSLISAQVPQKMSYQAVIRNSSDKLVTNTKIGMKISILQTTPTGTIVYTETQTPSTNANGLVSIEFGGGPGFDVVNWANGPYFIKTETDIVGGTNYTITGTSQLLSVPYALAAGCLVINKNSQSYDTYMKDDGTYMGLVHINVQQPFAAEPTVTDIDGNVYGTVKIGTQVWMAENLKTTHYRNGNTISKTSSNNETYGAWCDYLGSEANGLIYGHLYNWYAVADPRNIAPVGWHIATDAEWKVLINYLGSLAGGRMKEAGTSHWTTPNTDALNDSKFSALPGGLYTSKNYSFSENGILGSWWCSGLDGTFNGYLLWYNSNYFTNFNYSKNDCYSVRCIRD